MGVKTRSKPASQKKDEAESTKSTIKTLEASVDSPPQLFVLPKDASSEARIASIPNPATTTPSRYLVCPSKGFYEFTRIAAPKRQHRSWLLAPERKTSDDAEQDQEHGESQKDDGYVLQTPDMFVATPVDPLFILLPSLVGDISNIGQEFLAASDYVAKLVETSQHLPEILTPHAPGLLEATLESRIASVCDCMDMGDDKMYALSLPRLVKELASKAKRMTVKGLPASMEDRFVKQNLDVPVLSIKREESSINIATDDATPGAESQTSCEAQSQDTSNSASTTATVSTDATSVSIAPAAGPQATPEGVTDLLRLRVALNFLLSSYVLPKLRQKIEPLFTDVNVSGIDFAPLDKHMEHIASLKKEAQALRSLSDNISRKRSTMDDDEALDKAETKKRKKEEEDARKKNVSHGVKKLAKADTSGMKKMSSFFTKAPAKK